MSDDVSANEIDESLRQAPIPVVARIVDDAILFDVRTLRGDDIAVVTAAMQRMWGG
jgi:seryl-tRNA(Sec) selenium transferase